MFRPLSQRIRESGPVRLLLDNRLVRHFADKPVTTPPTRRQTVLIGLIPAVTVVAVMATYFILAAFHPATFGLLGVLSIVILLLGGLLIGRKLRSVICTILATGLYFVFLSSGAVQVMSDAVLVLNGDEVTAVVDGTVSNPTGCAAVSAFYSRITGNTVATTVRRLDGTPLPGAIGFGDRTHGNNHVYQKGERVQVLVDRAGSVCMRAKSDVHLVVDTITTVLAVGCVVWVFLVAALDWRIWRREKYEMWRDQAR